MKNIPLVRILKRNNKKFKTDEKVPKAKKKITIYKSQNEERLRLATLSKLGNYN